MTQHESHTRTRTRAENEPRAREREPTTSATSRQRATKTVGDKPVDNLWKTLGCGQPVDNFSVEKAVEKLWITCG
jgi:hypothetical protein